MQRIIHILKKKVIRFVCSKEKQAIIAGVKLGKNNFIASKFWSTEPYLIEIGDNCSITTGVKIFTHGGAKAVRKTHPRFDFFGKVKIGNFVYIGANSLIMPGVKIGDNVLIAAGSVVTKSIPSNVVVAGNPAKYVCGIDNFIKKNAKYNLDSKGMGVQEKRKLLLSLDDSKFVEKPNIKVTI